MQDTAMLRTQLAVATARVLEDLEAAGRPAADVDVLDVAERLDSHLGSFEVILAAALGRGRTAAGDALAERLWVDLGIGGRL